MEHENAQAMMMDALDGELATDQRVDLEAHLRACLSCSRRRNAVGPRFVRAPLFALACPWEAPGPEGHFYKILQPFSSRRHASRVGAGGPKFPLE